MNLDMIVGFIAGVGLYTGVRTIFETSKKMGIIQLVLTFLAPVITSLWCMKKTDFVFGGTDLEFLVQTATVDKMIEPWIILLIYIVLIGIIIYNISKLKIIKK